jgi:hypothetical protein
VGTLEGTGHGTWTPGAHATIADANDGEDFDDRGGEKGFRGACKQGAGDVLHVDREALRVRQFHDEAPLNARKHARTGRNEATVAPHEQVRCCRLGHKARRGYVEPIVGMLPTRFPTAEDGGQVRKRLVAREKSRPSIEGQETHRYAAHLRCFEPRIKGVSS